MRWPFIAGIVTAAVVALSSPAASQAATITIAAPTAIPAGAKVPFSLTVTRNNGIRDGILVELDALVPTSSCPETPSLSETITSESGLIPPEGDGPFSITLSLEFAHPGTYLLCAYNSIFLASSTDITVGPSAREAAEQAPATSLNITIRSHHGSSFSSPGHTSFRISSSPDAHLTFTLDHGGGSQHWRQPGPQSGEVEEEASESEVGTYFLEWTCRAPNLTYHYTVTAVGGSGPPLERTGRFKVALTSRWCRAARLAEQARNRRIVAKERREASERKRHEAEQHQRTIERFESNCRAIGGVPAEITTSEGRRVVCHSKTGGIIPVPT